MTSSDLAEPSVLNTIFPWERGTYDPPEAYSWLRENEPVRRVVLHDGTPAWLVTRYDDVRRILSDPRVSSNQMLPGFPQIELVPRPSEEESTFLNMDAPMHTVFRRLISKHFVVKKLDAMRPRIQALVDERIDDMLKRGEPLDFVEEIALPVPSTVIAWLLGVPPADHPFFNRETDALLAASLGTPEAIDRATEAYGNINAYVDGLITAREALDEPGEDILGNLVQASRDGVIKRQDVLNTAWLLLVAGHDTTANMISLGMLTLLEHPEQLAELRARPDLVPQAIEELLRYLTIVHLIVLRIATEDIEIGGVTIPAGEGIVPLNFSANRDDAHYPDAAALDIHRGARDHFAFGYGMHQCVGQPLARIELQIVFETVLRRLPDLKLAVSPADIPFKSHASINGIASLPVTV
ncbi:cytochrome P450 [Sphingopyxis chilensis]|uniref:cytochrome P450 n=1 Tax=Sphingopyxis chilensis TaxID=180400 RepID=UPI002DDCF947|nr:cytochrome P450 [Sphingopyxis chilensis]